MKGLIYVVIIITYKRVEERNNSQRRDKNHIRQCIMPLVMASTLYVISNNSDCRMIGGADPNNALVSCVSQKIIMVMS